MRKLWLIEGFCPKDCYHCLMPVAYEPVEQNGMVREYRKEKMACHHAQKKECEQEGECTFFQEAPQVLPKNAQWYEP
jgi:hypothetical protein